MPRIPKGCGAEEGTRTPTAFRPPAPKAGASANSATSASDGAAIIQAAGRESLLLAQTVFAGEETLRTAQNSEGRRTRSRVGALLSTSPSALSQLGEACVSFYFGSRTVSIT